MIRRSWLLLALSLAAAPLAYSQMISSLQPSSAPAGSGPVTVLINGAFQQVPPIVTWVLPGSNVMTNLNVVDYNFSVVKATIPAGLLTTPGVAQISVTQGTSPSNFANFTVGPPLPTLSSLSPNTAVAGSPTLAMTVNGANFPVITGAVLSVTWNGTTLQTSYVNSGQLTAVVPAQLLASPGVATVTLNTQPQPTPLTFTITQPALSLNSISPASVTAGAPSFTLTASGSGFTSATTVTWNGSLLSTSFINSTTLNATVPANLITTVGTASVGVAAPGLSSPAPLTFTINPAFTLTSLSPAAAAAGGPAFTLILNGTGFTAQATAYWNTTPLSTAFVNPNQLTALVPANLIGQPGTASITAQSSAGRTNALLFNVTTAPLAITSLSPNSAAAGGAAFTLTVNGSGFINGATVTWNGTPLSTTFVSGAQLTAAVPAGLITNSGTASVGVSISGQTSPSPLSFTITSSLQIISISPTSTAAGGPAFTLAVNATGYNSGAVVYWNSTPLFTTATNPGLAAAVPANLIAQPGSASITLQEPGNFISNAVPFTITSPALSITSISPNTTVAGSPAFNLTVNGSGFNANTVVNWNGGPLVTTPVNANQLVAAVPAILVAQSGTDTVTAQIGNQVSNGVTFTVTSSAFSITSISPNTAVAGSPAFSLTVNGTGFNTNTIVYWNSTALVGTAVSSAQLMAAVPANLVAQSGSATLTAQNGNQTSNGVTFTITSRALTLTSISPNIAIAGGPAFTLTATGSGFANGAQVTWNGTPLSTTFASTSQLTAAVPANLIATAGNASVGVAVAGQVSPAPLSFVISPGLTITSTSPPSAPAGGAAFTLTVNGTGFAPGTTILWNGSALPTTVVNANQMTATVPANLIAQQASVSITAQNGNLVSNSLTFPVVAPQPSLTLTSLSPNTAPSGSPALTLTVYGSGFSSGSLNAGTQVTWNGSPLSTTFVSATQLNALVPATLLATAGTAAVSVTGQPQPASLPFTISNSQTLTLTSISPSTVAAGGPAFTLTVTGTGFTNANTVTWNGSLLATTFVSATQLTAAVPATFIAVPPISGATVAIDISVPAGQTPPIALPLTITQGLTLTSLSPASAMAGGAAFTLTVNGTGFASGATVLWNSTPLATTFTGATQLTATVSAALIAQVGSASVTVSSGNLVSNALTFTIAAAVPVITGITPATVTAGGPAFTLTVNGTGFVSGGVVSLNGTALSTTFVSGTQVTAGVPATYIVQPGTAQITFANPGGAASNAVPLTITTPGPVITSIAPATAAVGGPAFTLTVTGTGFVTGATVLFNGVKLNTSFISGTQLAAAVTPDLIVQPGTVPITATNPGSAASNAVNLTITAPAPTITSISPSSVTAGAPAFTLTVSGTGFIAGPSGGAVVFINGTNISTTVVSATQITAQVPPNLIAQPGTLQVTVANQGGAQSNALSLTVTPALPTLTSVAPISAKVGDPTFTLSLTGTGFVQASIAQWNGAPLSTTFVSATQLTATIDAGRLILPATASVTVVNPPLPDGTPQISNAVTFTINPVTPVVSSISPTSVTAGSPALSLTVNGSGFINQTIIQWNTTPLTTHFVSATQVTADVPATLLAQAGTVTVTAVNPGNNVSAAFTFTINAPPPPVTTSLSQTSATAGDTAFTLTVTGTGFISGAVVNFGSAGLSTTFVSATQLTGAVPAGLLLAPGTFPVVVQQGTGSSSNALNFTVNLPPPPALRLNPPATAGAATQPTIDFGLNAAYPIAMTGTVTLTFASNATIPVDDPSIQFATGGRTFTFSVPANTTTLPPLLIQTGTVAGVITLKVTLTAGGVDVTPATGSTATITVPKSAPVIRTVKLIEANGYLEVDINGYSTTRDMTTAVFTLNPAPGGSFTSSVITVPVSALFTSWYQSAGSTAFGSQFTYAQPFTVIGNTNQIQSVTVTLTNSAGTSVSVTSN